MRLFHGEMCGYWKEGKAMFFLQFLRNTIPPDDRVMHDFVEHMLPGLFAIHADASAKGGDQSNNRTINEVTREKFEGKDDQSMVSHLLNGIFPTLNLLAILKDEGIGPSFLDDERRIYILSYLMHDIDKILMHNAILQGAESVVQIETWGRPQIEMAKTVVGTQLAKCGVEQFFPEYTAYLEDITYLIVNTQHKWGTNLHTHGWQFRLRERRIALLRELCTYSDKIAYLVPSPSAIQLSDDARSLTTILARLSEDQLVFCYHQLREVRGLLTNVVNTGIVHLFTDDRPGVWSYLFFSDGVIYIKRKSLQLTITTEQLVETVQAQLRQICSEVIKNDAPGFKFSIQGIAKHPGYYFEFLTLEEYLQLLIRFTILRTNNDIATIPLGKLRQMQEKGELPSDLPLAFQLDGRRIGMVSRFLSVVFNTVLSLLNKQQQELRAQTEQAVIQQLGLTPYWDQSKCIPNKGGVEYRWFWLAACFLQDHLGLDIEGDERSLKAVFTITLGQVLQLAGDALRGQLPQQYLMHLTRYLDSIVELPLAIRADGKLPNFVAELEHYELAKSKKRKLLCTLCNSAYPTEEQADNAVLFQPWVYKNKLSLYAGKNAGGICAICALELMMRQILLKGQLRLTGSKFEAQRTKYLAVYPNFFFTPETGAIVSGILDQLRDINFFTIRKQLEGRDITIENLLALDVFAAPAPSAQEGPRVIDFDDDDVMDDEEREDGENAEVDAEKESEKSNERSYIKYRPQNFPGLFLFGMRAGRDDNDTAAWAMPAFLALALPLVTGTKVVISEMSLPLFSAGRDFQETVVFDAPHPYLDRLLQGRRLRVNQLLAKLRVLTSVYRVNIDTYAKQGKPEWKHLSAIVRNLETDPLYLFSYLRMQQRGESLYAASAELYIHIYKNVLKDVLEADAMGRIEHCVNNYTVFYRGGYQSHSILKPVDIVAKSIINSPLDIYPDDLLLQIRGELKSWLDRVRSHQANGYAMFWGKDIDTKEAKALEEFVRGFYEEVFLDYCQRERGVLRSRINRFKDGCEAYYIQQRTARRIQEQEQPQEPEQVVL
jgi:CRISPR-associated protein Csc3